MLCYARACLAEVLYGRTINEVDDVNSVARLVRGAVITDSRQVYDCCRSGTYNALTSNDKRSYLEAATLRQAIEKSGAEIKWIHSDANVADQLTKPFTSETLDSYFDSRGFWTVVYDPLQRSSKKRRQEGLQTLESTKDELERGTTAESPTTPMADHE